MSLLVNPMKNFLAGIDRPADDISVNTSIDLLLNEAKQSKDESSALLSKIWGTFVGLFLGDPMKWGEFAATKSCIAERVKHWVFIRVAPNHSENSPYGEAVRYYSKPLFPATVADIMKVDKAEYQKYERTSEMLGSVIGMSCFAMTTYAISEFVKSARIQLPTDLNSFVNRLFKKS